MHSFITIQGPYFNMCFRIARTRRNLAAISRLQFRRTSLALTITCELCHFLLSALSSDMRAMSSDLEDSHVIPGLIHKCYLAKSVSLAYVPLSPTLIYSIKRTTRLLSCPGPENPSASSSTHTISPSSSSGCCGNTMTLSLLSSRVSRIPTTAVPD